MPEGSKDLDAILTAVLKEAGERGLLKGVSNEDLARMAIQARTRIAVTETGILQEKSKMDKERAREVVNAYEAWRNSSNKRRIPPGFECPEGILCYINVRGDSDRFIVPNLIMVSEVTPTLKRYFDLPEGVVALRDLRLEVPGWILDPFSDLVLPKKGKFVLASDVGA